MQFGALTNISLVRESLTHLLKKGRETKTRVWFDQELNWIVDGVIDVATEQDPKDVGICFQAYRSRTQKDLERINGYPVRLVKGFYNDYDIRPWSKVTENYSLLMDEVAKRSSYPCFATHDYALIVKAKKILKEQDGEIQFFAGVRDELAEELVREGYKVRIYLPYGQVPQFLWYGFPIFDMPRAIQRVLKFKTIS
jgi:proline dehydrogenase